LNFGEEVMLCGYVVEIFEVFGASRVELFGDVVGEKENEYEAVGLKV
jgi:hypothetical protein